MENKYETCLSMPQYSLISSSTLRQAQDEKLEICRLEDEIDIAAFHDRTAEECLDFSVVVKALKQAGKL